MGGRGGGGGGGGGGGVGGVFKQSLPMLNIGRKFSSIPTMFLYHCPNTLRPPELVAIINM